MKRLNLIYVKSNDINYADIKYLEKRFAKQKGSVSCDSIEIDLEDGSKEFVELMKYIEDNHMPHTIVREYLKFTDEEWEKTPYFRMLPGWIQDFKGGCEDYGTEIMYEQCAGCKSGALQLTSACFPVSEVKKKEDIFFLFPALIVSARLKKGLEEIKATGCLFKEIIDTESGRRNSNFFQIVIDTCLPSVSSRVVETGKCKVCNRKLIDYEGTVKYKEEDFFEKKDFYMMAESIHHKYGLGPYRHYGFVVSKRVKDVLRKFHAAICIPVYIEGMFERREDELAR